MKRYLLAGGGTAGHVNPLLAVADTITAAEDPSEVLVLGTAVGLEARLVPARGYELLTIPKVPFPRRPNTQAVTFPRRFRATIDAVEAIIRERSIDVVVGFGGYVSTPAYLAARRVGIGIAIHEANAKPGLANRLGARYTKQVGVAFAGTRLPNARFVGMPLRPEIEQLDREAARPVAVAYFGLDPDRPTLLVTGGSLGARRINGTILESAASVVEAGWQVLHITGDAAEITDPGIDGYTILPYCDRMDLALAAADFAVSRAGAATVSELSALGIPAVYVPYPVGNGEQRFNAAGVVEAGGGVLVDDAAFLPAWVTSELLPVLEDEPGREAMADAAASVGVLDGSRRFAALVAEALRGDPGKSGADA
ncbi:MULTISPECIES: UDP-N-acetylglucosamine--N-acetylmuramyl-(pentapeptide) pyrophosphoryl-undecaprenol N-acetylglucosamine transferase [unclassified Leifsonia]|uniref:UDP-N-acetylglucosamine--N-acetylmuramyl- (pentapeptide) pyrophosphoryl-undecaprenol N-acetylglucosamine transferase n=1 Tax=unclassified Leifsonia TaxID=2663824 RepID=UPI0006FB351C|nr:MULTISPECIES: UDP-N-acetylglucosamine--N-acetylmuramyl-(pentapeptide) pyrophosphoryl-undecaprenol N-acetylglucosamine transferase [unclassified Leifsonia]KQX06718.1 UDP-N-acetylglucosamine--N-acetylmuramyl-(pentapeptide) pyrophosphoryl-undecaprenol N-acetylglucosamine transferase [Leifsonia sp. Root1293]KRA11002.1 UDP-N-acetylglucosamine--N-acetylmuramyl-(pentapeptide) pyrophosphoryl-undecaprenol N-acetylglucosamine transferase [Leifsonia sp. Root60]